MALCCESVRAVVGEAVTMIRVSLLVPHSENKKPSLTVNMIVALSLYYQGYLLSSNA